MVHLSRRLKLGHKEELGSTRYDWKRVQKRLLKSLRNMIQIMTPMLVEIHTKHFL
nr:hypothetical protein Iba_chr02cCG5680 [Ipomoea batatas]